ncbi:hypothetical protein OA851_02430 [SAR86 cluster bacterium]|nr:hypothetical protein [SAR86 cluster bacterium]
MKKNILFFGYGDLGRRLSKILDTSYTKLHAVSRNNKDNKKPNHIAWDWTSRIKPPLEKIYYDLIVIVPKPTEMNDSGYEKGFIDSSNNIFNCIKDINFKKVIAISSTRVYGSDVTGVFDEDSDLNLSDFRAKIINSYENLLIKKYNQKVIILRMAGLYSDTSTYIAPNRIHRNSAAKIINFFFQNDFDKFENCFFNCCESFDDPSNVRKISNKKLLNIGFKF